GDWKFELTNFSSADALVFDISDPSTPAELTGGTYSGAGPYALQFSDHVSTASEYLAFTPDKILGINSIIQDAPSNLQSTAQQADYLIISHANFLTAVQPLVGIRAADGLQASLIDLQDVYDEFSYGIVDPAAVRAFIAFAYTHWQAPAPSYVLLVGDGTRDPKNHENYGRSSFFPPYLAFADPENGETAADSRYVSIVGADAMPDLMLGRLSVNKPEEVAAYLDKVSSYQSSPPSGDMLRSILAVTGEFEYAAQFPVLSDELLHDEYPGEPFSVQKVYWKWTHTDLPQARADIKNGINEGRLLVNYIGHGFSTGWGNSNAVLFLYSDIASLQNQNKYPFILAMTCSDGYFISPQPYYNNQEALAELITRAAQKGAIASWSSTAWGAVAGHDLLNRGAFHAIYTFGILELGAITQAGLARVWASGENLDLLETYLLFGDPAVRLPRALEKYRIYLPILTR
ncbi:MAG TPA: C25 family cysteine peptidase, partial [Anaerolineaceae bacterium]|nr:C25 family cysteine peptidase [Anaerolineaceae bacterium]